MITKADAVAAIEAVTHDLSGEIQFSDAIAAINALPDSVTDDMVERAAWALAKKAAEDEEAPQPTVKEIAEFIPYMRVALEAALLGKE